MLFLAGFCEGLAPLIKIIKHGLLPLVQFGIPIILIVLGTLDLGKAVVASKEDEIKNAQKMLIKRLIYAIAVFFVVTIVTVVFSLFGNAGVADDDIHADTQSWSTCWSKY